MTSTKHVCNDFTDMLCNFVSLSQFSAETSPLITGKPPIHHFARTKMKLFESGVFKTGYKKKMNSFFK